MVVDDSKPRARFCSEIGIRELRCRVGGTKNLQPKPLPDKVTLCGPLRTLVEDQQKRLRISSATASF